MKRRHIKDFYFKLCSLAGQLNSLTAVFEQVPYMVLSQFGDGLAGEKMFRWGGRGGGMGRGAGGQGGRGWVRWDSDRTCKDWRIHSIQIIKKGN